VDFQARTDQFEKPAMIEPMLPMEKAE